MLLAAGLFMAYGYFYQAGGWNQNSRFALTRAILEEGSLSIDKTMLWEGAPVTHDEAVVDGHHYTDKAPGLSFAAVPVVAVGNLMSVGRPTPSRVAETSYMATVALAGIPTVVAAMLVLWSGLALGASLGGAAFASVVFGIGTPAWAYATLFFGHALSTGCLMAAFAAAVALRTSGSARRDLALGSTLGLAGGWATITEYPAAVPAVIIAVLALASVWEDGWARRRRVAGAIACLALPCLGVLLLYNHAAFGGVLRLGYVSVAGFEGMHEGLLGVTYPKVTVAWELLFGAYRGLWIVAPILGAALWGIVRMTRDESTRAMGMAVLGIVVYYLLFNASYHYWEGGWSFGPRHMAPALPFFCLPLAFLWTTAKRPLRVAMGTLAAYGMAVALMAVAVMPQLPANICNPMVDFVLPRFIHGELSLNHQGFLSPGVAETRNKETDAINVGERLGLAGTASLLPLFAAWALLGATWIGSSKRRGASPPAASPSPPVGAQYRLRIVSSVAVVESFHSMASVRPR